MRWPQLPVAAPFSQRCKNCIEIRLRFHCEQAVALPTLNCGRWEMALSMLYTRLWAVRFGMGITLDCRPPLRRLFHVGTGLICLPSRAAEKWFQSPRRAPSLNESQSRRLNKCRTSNATRSPGRPQPSPRLGRLPCSLSSQLLKGSHFPAVRQFDWFNGPGTTHQSRSGSFQQTQAD
jgi:hypothetical protein